MEHLIMIDTLWEHMVKTIADLRESTRLHLEEKNLQIQLLEERIERLERAIKEAEDDRKKRETEIRQLTPAKSSLFSFMRIG